MSPMSHRIARRTAPCVSSGVFGLRTALNPTRRTSQLNGHTHAMEHFLPSCAKSNSGVPFGQIVIVTTYCMAAALSSCLMRSLAANSCAPVGAADPHSSQLSGRSAERDTLAMSFAAVGMGEDYTRRMTCPKCGKPDHGAAIQRCLCSGVRWWGKSPQYALNLDELERRWSHGKEVEGREEVLECPRPESG